MTRTKINLIQHLYEDDLTPIKEHGETVMSVLKRVASKDIKKFNSTHTLIKEITDEFSDKKMTVQDFLKRAANSDIGDKDTEGLKDFDIYLDLRTEKSEIALDDDAIERLKEKIRKIYSTLAAGQLYAILSGKGNPMKPGRIAPEAEKES